MSEPQPPILSYAVPESAKLVRIGPFGDLLDAGMARNRLAQEGIEVHTAGENLAAALGPMYGNAYAGGPFLLVLERDEAAARQIIADIESRRRARNAAGSPPCPACQYRPTAPVVRGVRWIALGILALALLLPDLFRAVALLAGLTMLFWPLMPGWKCSNCGHRFLAASPLMPVEEDLVEEDEAADGDDETSPADRRDPDEPADTDGGRR